MIVAVDGDRSIGGRLRKASSQQLTYAEVGGTRSLPLPAGYKHVVMSAVVGSGDAAWERAKDAVRLWKAQAHAHLAIIPQGAPIEEGTTVLAVRSFGPLSLVIPCRVVYKIDEPQRFGFGYGTLPGHPEQGEEGFHVALGEGDEVTAEIVAFSRPADALTKLAGPLAQLAENAVARRYLEGIQQHVRQLG